MTTREQQIYERGVAEGRRIERRARTNECSFCHRQIPTTMCAMVKTPAGTTVGIACLSCSKADKDKEVT